MRATAVLFACLSVLAAQRTGGAVEVHKDFKIKGADALKTSLAPLESKHGVQITLMPVRRNPIGRRSAKSDVDKDGVLIVAPRNSQTIGNYSFAKNYTLGEILGRMRAAMWRFVEPSVAGVEVLRKKLDETIRFDFPAK